MVNHIITEDQFIWVGDAPTSRLIKFDLNGNYLYSWGAPGGQPGRLELLARDDDRPEREPVSGRLLRGPGAEVHAAAECRSRQAGGADSALSGQELIESGNGCLGIAVMMLDATNRLRPALSALLRLLDYPIHWSFRFTSSVIVHR